MNFSFKFRLLLAFVLSLLVSACGQQSTSGKNSGGNSRSEGDTFSTGTHLDAPPLQIIGRGPREMFYDSHFEVEFGAAGGDGLYRYRYIKTPELDEDDRFLEPNIVDMTVAESVGPNPSMVLRATPQPQDDTTFDLFNEQEMVFGVELTDGRNTIEESYKFTLKKNELSFLGGERQEIGEGGIRDEASPLYDAIKDGNTAVCGEDEVKRKYVKTTLPDGRVVFPSALRVKLVALPATETELFYRISSEYNNSLSERDKNNQQYARPNVDFIEEEGSVVFQPGAVDCVVVVNILDDNLMEVKEDFYIEFFDRSGGFIDYSQARITVRINDNEPRPSFDSGVYTRNSGDTVSALVGLSSAADVQTAVSLVFDEESTPYDASLFTIAPNNGYLTFDPEETEGIFSVTLEDDEAIDRGASEGDSNLLFELDVPAEEDFSFDPLSIWINEWASTSASLSEEVVGHAGSGEEAVSFVVDPSQNVIVGFNKTFGLEQGILIKGYDNRGQAYDLTETGDITYQKEGVELKLIDLDVYSETGDILVVAQTDGLVTDAHYGGLDFITILYRKTEEGTYELEHLKQFGTEEDDIVTNAKLAFGGSVYVWGNTQGKRFNSPTQSVTKEENGVDGFVLRTEAGASVSGLEWYRFIGDDVENIHDLSATPSQIVMLGTQTNGFQDAGYINSLEASGSAIEEFRSVRLLADGDQFYTSLLLDNDYRNYYVLVNTNVDLFSNFPTSSRTQELHLLYYSLASGNLLSANMFTSNNHDEGKKLFFMSDDKTVLVAGETTGNIESQSGDSRGETDLFVMVLEEKGNSPEVVNTVQFGSPGRDTFIDIMEAHEGKFMVLWSEDYSSGDGTITYRVSPFSIDGEKLTPDP